MLLELRAPALAGLLALGLAGSSVAAEERRDPPTVDPPAPAIPTRDAAREQAALKIAGLVVFVANSCPKLRPDYARFRAILRDLGMTEETLAQPDVKSRYLAYTAAYGRDAAASCERASAQFGAGGSTLPNLFTAP